MKILFINPPIEHAVQLRGPNRVWAQHEMAPPLGIMSLSSFLKERGYHEIRLINGQTPQGVSDAEILRTVREWRPDLVGFSVNLILFYNACRLAGLIKQALPEVKVVFGGPHLTEYPEETVTQPDVDFGVYGEGEYTLFELIQALEGKGELESIAGLAFKRDGQVVKNPPRDLSMPLDELPMPDHSLFDLKQHRIQFDDQGPTGIIIASRGCPFRCAFCCRNYPYYRLRGATSIVDEMFALKRLGYRSITFYDDNFNVKKERVLEVCEEIRSRGFDLPWSFRGRVDRFDEELARAVAQAGCIRVYFGVESGTDEILQQIRKDTTVAQIREAFALCHKYGLITVGYFIFGFPGETMDQARQTLKLAFEIDPDFVVFQALIPQPGSQIYLDAMAAGVFDDYFREFARHPKPELYLRSWETTMTEEEIFGLMRGGLLRFYFRPSYLLKSLRRVDSLENFLTKAVTATKMMLRMV